MGMSSNPTATSVNVIRYVRSRYSEHRPLCAENDDHPATTRRAGQSGPSRTYSGQKCSCGGNAAVVTAQDWQRRQDLVTDLSGGEHETGCHAIFLGTVWIDRRQIPKARQLPQDVVKAYDGDVISERVAAPPRLFNHRPVCISAIARTPGRRAARLAEKEGGGGAVPRVSLDYGNVVYVDAPTPVGVSASAKKFLLIKGQAGDLNARPRLGR